MGSGLLYVMHKIEIISYQSVHRFFTIRRKLLVY